MRRKPQGIDFDKEAAQERRRLEAVVGLRAK